MTLVSIETNIRSNPPLHSLSHPCTIPGKPPSRLPTAIPASTRQDHKGRDPDRLREAFRWHSGGPPIRPGCRRIEPWTNGGNVRGSCERGTLPEANQFLPFGQWVRPVMLPAMPSWSHEKPLGKSPAAHGDDLATSVQVNLCRPLYGLLSGPALPKEIPSHRLP